MDDTNPTKITITSLDEVLQKTKGGLKGALEDYLEGKASNDGDGDNHNDDGDDSPSFNPSKDGLDVFHVKNSVMTSYLIDLVMHIKTVNAQKTAQTSNKDSSHLNRLNESKIVLEKMKGLQKKMQYQIDKLQQAASESSSAPSAQQYAYQGENPAVAAADEPLNYRPNLIPNMSGSEADGSGDGDDSSSDSGRSDGHVDKDDEDLAHAKATLGMSEHQTTSSGKKKYKTKNYTRNHGKEDEDSDDDGEDDAKARLYQAPRTTSVPYSLDRQSKNEKRLEKEKRDNRRMRNSEMAQQMRQDYGDAPEQEDLHGGTDYGKQQHAARQFAEKQAERTRYEESAMIRMTTSRTEKKERNRLMRSEQSNLTAIADLNNLTKGMEGIYGGDKNDRGGDSDDEHNALMDYQRSVANGHIKAKKGLGRHANGKRSREEDPSSNKRKTSKSKSRKSKNSLQSDLYN